MDSPNFRSLRVWQLGMQLAEEAHRLSHQFPRHEIYGLASQMQRASVSVPANIAEGHARGSTKEFLRFLSVAQGSLAELETHLLLAERFSYGNSDEIRVILNHCTSEAKMLRGLRKQLRRRLEQE